MIFFKAKVEIIDCIDLLCPHFKEMLTVLTVIVFLSELLDNYS